MNIEIFNIGLEFHKLLIRPTIQDKNIQAAIECIGTDKKTDLYKVIEERVKVLKDWYLADNKQKFKLYCIGKSRPPKKQVFTATMEYMDDVGISIASNKHKVNAMSLYVLKPRIERYDAFSARVNTTLNNLL